MGHYARVCAESKCEFRRKREYLARQRSLLRQLNDHKKEQWFVWRRLARFSVDP